MGLFGKSKAEELPSFDAQANAQANSEELTSKEIELVSSIKDEFSMVISGILRQSQKKLQATNDSLGHVESRLHNIKIYQVNLRRMADEIEGKLLYMRGGSPETIEQDLAEEEQNVITYLKGTNNHLSSVIIELRDLRRLLSKVSVVPTDPQMSPLESGREFGVKVVELVHKVERDLGNMYDNIVKIYELEKEVFTVAQEHGITFPQAQQPQNQQSAQQPQNLPPQ